MFKPRRTPNRKPASRKPVRNNGRRTSGAEIASRGRQLTVNRTAELNERKERIEEKHLHAVEREYAVRRAIIDIQANSNETD